MFSGLFLIIFWSGTRCYTTKVRDCFSLLKLNVAKTDLPNPSVIICDLQKLGRAVIGHVMCITYTDDIIFCANRDFDPRPLPTPFSHKFSYLGLFYEGFLT